MPLKEVAQTDFSGGINIVTSPYVLAKKQLQQVNNMILDEHGSLRTRDGQTSLAISPVTTDPLVHRGVLNTTASTTFPFAIQSITSGTNRLYRTDTSPWTNIGNFGTTFTTPDSVTIGDKQLIAAGYETPWTWDGTTFAQVTALGGQTVPPGAKHLAFHLGSIWLWNTNTTTTTLDGKSSLRASNGALTTDWPNANQTFISKDDGQEGMGLAVYTIAETGVSPTATLVAFKNYSAYQVTGVFGSTAFAVQKIKSDMGCIAPRTIQFVSGFGIIRLTHKGFALYNGVDDRLISEEIRPYIFGRDTIGGLNFTNIDRAWATQAQNPPLYVCACPSTAGSTALDRVFIYDLVRRAWTICTFPKSFQTLSLFATPTTQPVIHAGTNTGGSIEVLFNGASSDNGAAVSWSFVTQAFFLGSPMRRAYWRRMVLDLLFTPNQAVTVSTALGGIASALGQTQTFGPFAGGSAGQIERRLSYGIKRTVPTVTATVSGTGAVRVRGVGFQAAPKPLTSVSA